MAAGTPTRVVVTDANIIIINLIHAGRLALLGVLPPYEFVVPEEVMTEIADPAQRGALEAAITAGRLHRETITTPAELRGRVRRRAGRSRFRVQDLVDLAALVLRLRS